MFARDRDIESPRFRGDDTGARARHAIKNSKQFDASASLLAHHRAETAALLGEYCHVHAVLSVINHMR
jgi:hypothetical protein